MNNGKSALLLIAACGLGACGERATEAPAAAEDPTTEAAIRAEGGLPLSAPSENIYRAHLAAQALIDRGDFVDANQAAIDLTETAPDYIGGWILLGNSALSGEQFVKATRKAQKVKPGATEAEQLWADINMSFVTNDTAEGLRIAENLCETYPDSPRAYLVLSGIYTAQLNHAAAREAGRKAVELAPGMAVTHANLGFEYMYNEPKDQTEAQKHFLKAIELEPDEDNNWVNLGDSHRAAADLERAAADYSRALELDSTNAVAAVKRGHVNSFLGNYDQARADYDQGIAAGKGKAQTQSTLANYRAFVHLHAGNPAAAIDELQGVNEEIDGMEIPEHQKIAARNFVLTNIADIAFYYDMDDEATRAVTALAATLATSGEASGDADFARQQKATAIFWQGKLDVELGNFDAARSKAREFADLLADDENPRRMERYHEILGLAALRQGDFEKSIAEYRQSNLSTSPGAGDVKNIYMLATALEAAGRNEEAAELKNQVANWNFNSAWFAMLRKDAAGKS